MVPHVERFLGEQGRMKFCRPLYKAMFNAQKLNRGRDKALQLFAENKHKYHPIAAKMCMVDLKLAPEQDGAEEG